MCEQESDDHEAVSKLLEINDSIHRTIERWKLVKLGDLDGASKIPQGTLGTSTGVGKNADNELSLIDFGPDEPAPATNGASATTAPSKSNSNLLEDDLLGLSLQDSSAQQSNGIFLGGPMPQSIDQPPQQNPQPNQISQLQAPTSTAPSSQTGHVPMKPNYDPFATLTTSHPSSRSQTPAAQSMINQVKPQTSPDPFASLSSPPPRQSSPFSNFQQSQPTASTPSKSLFDLGSTAAPANQPHPTSQAAPQHNDDDWEFSSAVPEESQASSQDLIVSNSEIKILFHVERPPESNDSYRIRSSFSNNTPSQVTDYTFQLAVTKVCCWSCSFQYCAPFSYDTDCDQQFRLQLVPQSGRTLQPNQQNGIVQEIIVHAVPIGQAGLVKMRWKASWKVMGNLKQEQGEVPVLSIA